MHRIGEIPNNCKCLWIQVGAELVGVQLLFLGLLQGSPRPGWPPGQSGAAYKGIRETVQHGSLYRLISPRDRSEQSVAESVSLDKSLDKKQGVLFTFLHSSQMGYPFPRVLLRGLDPKSE
jgi:hypothetical protein